VSLFLDTSVLLASLDPDEPNHAACDELVASGGHGVYVHALAETFSILTGGKQGRRLSAALAARLIQDSVLPYVRPEVLSGPEVMLALSECESRGVRGGAIYDWLHLAAARHAGAEALVTLDQRDFLSIARPGDPRIDGVGGVRS
jgi:predicted nucleic acid-binding protein